MALHVAHTPLASMGFLSY